MMNMENEDWIANGDPFFTDNTCSTQLTSMATVSISTSNTVSLSSEVGTDSQSACINNVITEITYSTTGATGIGSATDLPAGVAASWASNKITISGIPTESGTFSYSIPLTGGCGSVSATGTITVNSIPEAPTAGSNTYTYDGNVKTAVANVGASETIDWYAAATGNTTSSAPTATDVNTYSAYAEARNTTTGCVSSSRTLITLEITKATLTATADSQTKIYGASNPTLTFTYSGWVNGVETIDTPPIISTTVEGTTVVGTYASSISLAGGTDNNYTFILVSGDFEVTKAILTATADAQTKVYGEANDALTFQYSGWQNGDDEADLTTEPVASTLLDETSPVGPHVGAITVAGGVDENYSFSTD